MELLAAHLKQDGFCTIKDLAELHLVSKRTIARDLQLMRDQGLPIDADRGRGGGVRLDRNWGVGRLNLSYTEAVDLLISIAVAEQMNSPIFLANLGSIKRQLVASFAPDKRNRVERIKSRILIGATASTTVQGTIAPSGNRVIQTLHQSFLNQNSILIRYQDEGGRTTTREIEAHYLLLNYPVWYVLAFDHFRAAPRTFRCDRIVEADTSTTRFQLLPKDSFKQTFEGYGLENLKAALSRAE
ncbi:transcriptional regulator [Paremcibacter congregatus]|uniref:Transcriptional regulator n=1 Tax=Paremcibacter congregatus TaxID=2043170 RepID=A0A2G4YR07_9PROT|nr:transcriptional regulator [Paremcibacter congregatus]QDE29337.1 WYL domain-containing protein [Paremcibacter congregatus]